MSLRVWVRGIQLWVVTVALRSDVLCLWSDLLAKCCEMLRNADMLRNAASRGTESASLLQRSNISIDIR